MNDDQDFHEKYEKELERLKKEIKISQRKTRNSLLLIFVILIVAIVTTYLKRF